MCAVWLFAGTPGNGLLHFNKTNYFYKNTAVMDWGRGRQDGGLKDRGRGVIRRAGLVSAPSHCGAVWIHCITDWALRWLG